MTKDKNYTYENIKDEHTRILLDADIKDIMILWKDMIKKKSIINLWSTIIEQDHIIFEGVYEELRELKPGKTY